MSKKERDIWDDAIRSKLEDFEMDTLPGDWEAIADRLPGKAPVPLRRTLRYWVAAAVISLLVVSGGIYLYDREMEDLPIAQEIQSSQESTSVDTPVVPIEKTMEQAPVLATIPAAAVVKAKAASGAVKVGAKARMAAFRQNVESAEDRPISESEVMSADRSANEKNTVEPEVERNNDENNYLIIIPHRQRRHDTRYGARHAAAQQFAEPGRRPAVRGVHGRDFRRGLHAAHTLFESSS